MSLPLVRLPSLDLVKGFVAVGRRMSITLAAEDLCLTQSAVSRQVSSLEEALGVKLLVRGHRSIRFTVDGEKFFKVADMAVQQLQDATAAMHKRHEKQPVTITASIGVVGLWLVPRLGALNEELPDVDVRIATSNKLMDLRAEGVDIAVRYCAPSAAPEGAVPLFGETLVPVAHPSLHLRGRPAAEVVKQHVLLELDEPQRPWLQWNEKLKLMGLERLKPRGIIRFNQYDQLIHAATSGRGVALGRSALVAPLVKAGSLEALGWDQGQWTSSHQYWLVQSDPSPTPDVHRVCQWIRRQAASDTH
ncbi:LysR substrate-binding domain-containing protein [Sorangium sp. So ce385]|uniref:LysR substrate-binding domain-containing protein n=1 Tax=Sorangium sp. So ce385 TaxID=3133308 RepID=UPI003F5BB6C6